MPPLHCSVPCSPVACPCGRRDASTSTAEALRCCSSPCEAVQRRSGPSVALQRCSSPCEAFQRCSGPSVALQRSSSPSLAVWLISWLLLSSRSSSHLWSAHQKLILDTSFKVWCPPSPVTPAAFLACSPPDSPWSKWESWLTVVALSFSVHLCPSRMEQLFLCHLLPAPVSWQLPLLLVHLCPSQLSRSSDWCSEE